MSAYSPGSEGLLMPLQPFMQQENVSEILINKPQEVWVEQYGNMASYVVPELTSSHLSRLCQLIANENKQRLTPQAPLLSGNLHDGTRVQLCLPPSSECHTISIRRKVIKQTSLYDYQNIDSTRRNSSVNETTLDDYYRSEDWPRFIAEAIHQKKNIVISGGTSTGKTTFLNACLQEIDLSERMIVLEDTREIEIPHPNKVHLLAAKGGQGESNITMQDLIQCSLRLRPDRIIMGEIRGAEIMDFISACSTGHEGSMTSIHANNPQMAFRRMVQLYKLNNVPSMRDQDILEEIRSVVDIVVQLERVGGQRRVTDVSYFKCL